MNDKYDTTVLQSKTCMNVAILCQKALNYLDMDGRLSATKTEKYKLKTELCSFLSAHYVASRKVKELNSQKKIFDIT